VVAEARPAEGIGGGFGERGWDGGQQGHDSYRIETRRRLLE
jgi:hypothetical protein